MPYGLATSIKNKLFAFPRPLGEGWGEGCGLPALVSIMKNHIARGEQILGEFARGTKQALPRACRLHSLP